MKATQLLAQQHREVSALFERFEAEEDEGARLAIFDEIGTLLAAHDAIERELFYPACKDALGDDEEVLVDAVVEHGVIEFSIYKADIAEPDTLASCMRVLREIVDHHVDEEEAALFPKIEVAMSAADLDALGHQMAERFAVALEKDFRVAVRASLDQVLEGAAETDPFPGARAAGMAAEDEGDNEIGVDDDDVEADETSAADTQAAALDEVPLEPPASRTGFSAKKKTSQSGTRPSARR
jgi:hypothetical protein